MKLSARLREAASLVSVRTTAADIGTDHGYIPVWLCEQNRVRKAIAMDLREGPLQRARDHIREAGLEERIETRLSDGMAALLPGEADCAVITGMGGILISRILRQTPDVTHSLQELVLGPQSDEDLVRRTLLDMGFRIDREKMLKEDGKYYMLIHAVPRRPEPASGGSPEGTESRDTETGKIEKTEKLTEEEARFGPCLLRERDPVLLEYLRGRRETAVSILQKLSGRTGEAAARRMQIEEEKRLIEAACKRYEL